MALEEVHELDVSTVFELTFKDADLGTVVDVSGTSEKDITFRRPDGTTFTKSTVFAPDGVDGKVKYVVADATILTPSGQWKFQGRVKWATGDEWRSDVHEFVVHPNL